MRNDNWNQNQHIMNRLQLEPARNQQICTRTAAERIGRNQERVVLGTPGTGGFDR